MDAIFHFSPQKGQPMDSILHSLSRAKALISDGAWGTLLQARGLGAGECPESWNQSRPDDVLAVAKSYIQAGADMIETNSFGGSRFKLAHYGLDKQVGELNRRAAALSREAAGESRHVIGSVGPSGKMLITAEVSLEQLYEGFAEQLCALEAGGADGCCIETMSDIEEACIAVRAARENTGLTIICTFTFEKTLQNEYRTMMGVAPGDIVMPLIEAGADIIGTNCGNGMAGMVEIVRQMRAADPVIPILVHANAGLPRILDDGSVRYPESPEQMAAQLPQLLDAGAGIIGGCCGTTPEHIRALAGALNG
jgi:5-methyltetrahydrofolate--homocysteine methyltransferase